MVHGALMNCMCFAASKQSVCAGDARPKDLSPCWPRRKCPVFLTQRIFLEKAENVVTDQHHHCAGGARGAQEQGARGR